MLGLQATKLDPAAQRAGEIFLLRIQDGYAPVDAFVYGSCARGEQTAESDVDIAIILAGDPKQRWAAATFMAGVAFDVMQETGVLIDPLPLWRSEFDAPETFSNPALIHTIRREGVRL